MKKRLFCVILAVCLLACCFVGCSGKDELKFNTDFYSAETKDPIKAYSEKTTYTVQYASDYENLYGFSKADLDNDVVSLSYGVGSYVSSFSVVPDTALKGEDVPNGVKNSDILKDVEGQKFYILETEFSIPVTYKIKDGEQKSVVDTINSKVYFCGVKQSYAPIYSELKSVNTLFTITDTDAAVTTRALESVVCYNKSNYTMTKKVDDQQATVVKKDYDFKTIVDNAQLLFVLRNLSVSSDSTSYVPALANTYNKPTELAVTNSSENSIKYNFNYCGNQIDEQIKVKRLSYALSNSATAGAYQYLVVQRSESDNVKSNALLTTYVHSLYCGGIGYYGVLVYNLTNVEIQDGNA